MENGVEKRYSFSQEQRKPRQLCRKLCEAKMLWLGREHGHDSRWPHTQGGQRSAKARAAMALACQATFDLSVECTPQSMVVKMQPALPSEAGTHSGEGISFPLHRLLEVAARHHRPNLGGDVRNALSLRR